MLTEKEKDYIDKYESIKIELIDKEIKKSKAGIIVKSIASLVAAGVFIYLMKTSVAMPVRLYTICTALTIILSVGAMSDLITLKEYQTLKIKGEHINVKGEHINVNAEAYDVIVKLKKKEIIACVQNSEKKFSVDAVDDVDITGIVGRLIVLDKHIGVDNNISGFLYNISKDEWIALSTCLELTNDRATMIFSR